MRQSNSTIPWPCWRRLYDLQISNGLQRRVEMSPCLCYAIRLWQLDLYPSQTLPRTGLFCTASHCTSGQINAVSSQAVCICPERVHIVSPRSQSIRVARPLQLIHNPWQGLWSPQNSGGNTPPPRGVNFLPSPSLPLPYHSPPFPLPSFPLPSLPLEVGPLKSS